MNLESSSGAPALGSPALGSTQDGARVAALSPNGFGEMVVGTGSQPVDPILAVATGGQHRTGVSWVRSRVSMAEPLSLGIMTSSSTRSACSASLSAIPLPHPRRR